MKTCTTPTQIESALKDAEVDRQDVFADSIGQDSTGQYQAEVLDGVTEEVICLVVGESYAKVRSLFQVAGIEVHTG